MTVRHGYADTATGQVHYAECGAGRPVVLLHQTPRSTDEYRELLPLLGRTHRAIAVDLPGFGASHRPGQHRIETYADAVLALCEALGLAAPVLVGHHTGGVVALEAAARDPGRVSRLVLSSTPYVDADARAARAVRAPIDLVTPRADGDHLGELWRRRQPYYPADRPDLLARFVTDALRAVPDPEAGHRAVGRYRMEQRIGLVRCPVLCVGASADPFAFPDLKPLAAHLAGAEVAVVDGGMVPLMEERADEVAELIGRFLA